MFGEVEVYIYVFDNGRQWIPVLGWLWLRTIIDQRCFLWMGLWGHLLCNLMESRVKSAVLLNSTFTKDSRSLSLPAPHHIQDVHFPSSSSRQSKLQNMNTRLWQSPLRIAVAIRQWCDYESIFKTAKVKKYSLPIVEQLQNPMWLWSYKLLLEEETVHV